MLDGGRKGDDGGKGDEGGKGDDYLEDDDDLEQVDDEDACSRLHLRRPLLIALLNDFYLAIATRGSCPFAPGGTRT